MINVKHILHPTDFGESSDEALKYACSLATLYSASLHLIHVVDDVLPIAPPLGGALPADYYVNRENSATEELAEYPDRLINHGGTIVRNVVKGKPFVEIIRYAKENMIDLIVMGTHGHTGLEHLLIGSVAENVVRKAPCPVLTIHPKDFKFITP